MSIAPEHARRIFAHDKTHEFRRVRPRVSVPFVVYVYETRPVCAVTGSFLVPGMIIPDDLGTLEPDSEARRAVCRYLEGARCPAALRVQSPHRFVSPVPLGRLGVARPPQSYMYVPVYSL